jgi:hypothetical protein
LWQELKWLKWCWLRLKLNMHGNSL